MMYIDTYETQTYKYFLKLLKESHLNISIFGSSQSGKSSLIKSWFKENVKNNLILSLNSKKHLAEINRKIHYIYSTMEV
jgi:predicted GTPase